MPRARAVLDFDGTVPEAEALWYDVDRWAAWVDGFSSLTGRDGAWPAEGAEVRWRSTPGGRGHVRERSLRHEPGAGQTVEVQDDQMTGTQAIGFAALADGVEATLELSYELKSGGPLRRLVDVVFIRRAQADSLRRTLARFAQELAAAREPLL